MNKNKVIIILFIVICICGCSLLKPKLAKRYATGEWRDAGENLKLVEVSAFALNKPSSKISLADTRSLSALVSAIGNKAQNMTELRANLAELELVKGVKEEEIDKTTFSKRIAFAVDKKRLTGPGNFGLADRINNLTVRLEIPPLIPAKFSSWDRFETAEEVVDLGSVKSTQKITGELTVAVGELGGHQAPATVTPKITAERALDETINLNQRRIKLSGKILNKGKKAELRQEGAVGRDLTGTFIVDVVIIPVEDAGKGENLAKKRVTIFTPPKDKTSEAQVEFAWLKYYVGGGKRAIEPISCNINYDYILRHAREDRIYAEGYQDAVYYEGKDVKGEPEPLVLVEAADLKATVYCLEHPDHRRLFLALKSKDQSEQDETLRFPSYTGAMDFLKWLKKTKITQVAGYFLFIPTVTDSLNGNIISKLNIVSVPLNYRQR